MSKRYIKLAVFVLAVLVTLTGCKSSAEKEQGPKPVAVEVKLVERGEVQAGTVLSGPVRACLLYTSLVIFDFVWALL